MEEHSIVEMKVFSLEFWKQVLNKEMCNATAACRLIFFTTLKPLKNIY
jgi:hypothetical protein